MRTLFHLHTDTEVHVDGNPMVNEHDCTTIPTLPLVGLLSPRDLSNENQRIDIILALNTYFFISRILEDVTPILPPHPMPL
jgi:hypothetical protein